MPDEVFHYLLMYISGGDDDYIIIEYVGWISTKKNGESLLTLSNSTYRLLIFAIF